MKTMNELYKQCKKLEIFILSKKIKKFKNVKKWRKKSGLTLAVIRTTQSLKETLIVQKKKIKL